MDVLDPLTVMGGAERSDRDCILTMCFDELPAGVGDRQDQNWGYRCPIEGTKRYKYLRVGWSAGRRGPSEQERAVTKALSLHRAQASQPSAVYTQARVPLLYTATHLVQPIAHRRHMADSDRKPSPRAYRLERLTPSSTLTDMAGKHAACQSCSTSDRGCPASWRGTLGGI